MKFQYRNLFKSQKGQAAVELALVLPFLLLILCGIIEVGWLFSNQLTISNLSREGARIGVVYSSNLDRLQIIEDKIIELIPNGNLDKYTIEVSYSNPAVPRNGDIIVNIVYHARPITPLTGIFVHGDIDLSSKCVMKLE